MAGPFAKFTTATAGRIARAVRGVEGQRRDGRSAELHAAQPRVVPNPTFAVKCSIDGGSGGSASTTCSFTYTVTTLSGRTLGEEMTPQQRRHENVPYTTTPNEAIGVAYFDEAGTFRLWSANELPALEDCEPEP